MVRHALEANGRAWSHALYAMEHALDALIDARLPHDWREPLPDYACRGNPHTAKCPPSTRKPVVEPCYCAGMGYRAAIVDGKYALVDCVCRD